MIDVCDIQVMKPMLAAHGFHFSKAKGQNFLIAPWVPQSIAEQAGVDETAGVLEIGPGIGPADPAAVSPRREGLRGGGGRAPETHSGHHRGEFFQSGNSLGRRAEAGHPRAGEGEVRHSPPHGLRQPPLLYHLPHSHGAAGSGVLPVRHRHGAEGSGAAHRGKARHPGLQRVHRVLPVLRRAGASVRRARPLLPPPTEGHVGGHHPAHPAEASMGDRRRCRVFPRRPRQLRHAAQEAVQRSFLRLPGAGKGRRGSGDRGGRLRCQRAGRNSGIPEFARIANEIVRRKEKMRP